MLTGLRYRILVVVLVAAWLQAGCAARKALIIPAEAPGAEIQNLSDAIQTLIKNYGKTDSLKAGGRIETAVDGEKDRQQASFALMVERPNRVRLRVYRPFATMFDLISDGRDCWLHVPSARAAYLSEGCEAFRVGEDHVPVSPRALAAAVVVVPDVGALSTLPATIVRDGDLLKLTLADVQSIQRDIWMDAATGLAVRQRLADSDGMPLADIAYNVHALVEGTYVPVVMDIALPRSQAVVSLRMQDVRVGARLPTGAFEFSPPAGTEIVPVTGME
jgi:outer membrane lipoprotein-sorting protein